MPLLPFLICTWFGSGRLKPAPGSWGSAAALPFAWLLQSLGGPLLLGGAVVAACAAAMWAIPHFLRHQPGEDPGEIVIDEVAGQWLTLLLVPTDPWLYLAGFAAFRVFDIVKVWPASCADRSLHGATGVLVDDLFAGLWGLLVMLLLLQVW